MRDMNYKIAYNALFGSLAVILIYAVITGMTVQQFSILMVIFMIVMSCIPKED